MRNFILCFCFLLSPISQARAAIVEIPFNQAVNIVGPYGDGDYQVGLTGSVDYSLPQIDPHVALITVTALFSVSGYLSQSFYFCESNQPSCQGFQPSAGYAFIGRDFGTSIEVTAQFQGFFESLTVPPPQFPTDPTMEVFADLPDGFSIAPVPEPSTWAMLLIGFVGIGGMTFQRKRNAQSA